MPTVLVLGILIAVAAYLLIGRDRANDRTPRVSTGAASRANFARTLAYLSRGKLFLRRPDGNVQELHSPYIQKLLDSSEKRQALQGWKQKTSFETSFASGRARMNPDDQLKFSFTAASFVPGENTLLYFIHGDSFGGLFKHDLGSGEELRLIHRQNLRYEDLHFDPLQDRLLCTTRQQSGVANLVSMSRDGSEYRELTAGDSCDTAPCWVDDQQVVFQSQGIARSGDGYLMAYGPASLQLLDLDTSEIRPVRESDQFDFLQPRVCSNGNLYYLKRPYNVPTYGSRNVLVDAFLFPFRLLRAVFHYLNFFSLMYSRKPLTGAGGPELQADMKTLMLKGMHIDAERALKRERRVNGVPSLVPATWELIRRTAQGREDVLATHVAAFEIDRDDAIVYTNGYGVFQVTPSGSATVFQDQVVEDLFAQ